MVRGGVRQGGCGRPGLAGGLAAAPASPSLLERHAAA